MGREDTPCPRAVFFGSQFFVRHRISKILPVLESRRTFKSIYRRETEKYFSLFLLVNAVLRIVKCEKLKIRT